MEGMYKVLMTPIDLSNSVNTIQSMINTEYSNGYEFVQMSPHPGYNCYYFI